VEKILHHFAIDGAQNVDSIPLHELLRTRHCITHLTEPLLDAVCQQLDGQDRERFDQYNGDGSLRTASLLDLIDLFPSVKLTAEDLPSLLKKMQPRLYSIASATSFRPDRLDLAVVVVCYKNFQNRDRYGVASHYLCHQLPLHKPIKALIIRSKFRLPEDSSRDVIMVGPGTGIAPFRSFLQERASLRKTGKAVGRNWLFFGGQYRVSNFYYQSELEDWQNSGDLTHLDLAFSRDQDRKIYVQDRIEEKGQEVWNWLSGGAYFYVCGDATHMARDVDQTLMRIVQRCGAIDDPENFLTQLKQEKRYQRDVY
jgi:sulfite reductase (NADPH) flavoprotein alpha-component